MILDDFGYHVYVLLITCSQGPLNYLTFQSFDYERSRWRFLLLFRCVILILVSFHYSSFRFVSFPFRKFLTRNCYFLNKIVVGCFIYTYRHILFTENTLVKKNRTRQDTKFKGINCAESHSQLIMLIYTFYSENFTLSLQFRYMCPKWTSNTIYNPAALHFSFCHAILCQGSK